MEKNFFEVKNQTETSAEIYIVGQIMTEKPWYEEGEERKDNYLRDFIDSMQELKEIDNLDIHINSPGGALFAGITMYNLLKNMKAKKKVFVDGSAASAASVVAMAGDEIIIPKNAFLMVHKPMMSAFGNANDFQKCIDTLNTLEVGMISVYEDNLLNEKDKELIKSMVQDETWINGEEAAKLFKNTKVTDSIDIAACNNFDFTCYSHVPKELLNFVKSKDDNKINEDNEIKNKKELKLAKAKLGLAIS